MNNTPMNTEMTKAILDGRKVQTRRVVKAKITNSSYGLFNINMSDKKYIRIGVQLDEKKIIEFILKNTNPKYKKDEVIWVREPAKIVNILNRPKATDSEIVYEYLADNKISKIPLAERLKKENGYPKWLRNHQGIPNGCIKEMARIFLKITDVRVEKLQNTKTEDILSEGIVGNEILKQTCSLSSYYKDLEDKWISLWNKITPKGFKREDNPYVFVYEFKRVNKDGSKL